MSEISLGTRLAAGLWTDPEMAHTAMRVDIAEQIAALIDSIHVSASDDVRLIDDPTRVLQMLLDGAERDGTKGADYETELIIRWCDIEVCRVAGRLSVVSREPHVFELWAVVSIHADRAWGPTLTFPLDVVHSCAHATVQGKQGQARRTYLKVVTDLTPGIAVNIGGLFKRLALYQQETGHVLTCEQKRVALEAAVLAKKLWSRAEGTLGGSIASELPGAALVINGPGDTEAVTLYLTTDGKAIVESKVPAHYLRFAHLAEAASMPEGGELP